MVCRVHTNTLTPEMDIRRSVAILTGWTGRTAASAAGLASVVREIACLHRERARHRPRPPRQGLVLEVGGGQSPHPRANVVVDKYVADSFERSGEAPLDLSRPLVVADGHRLPFGDESFAYAIALHVLEHAADPVQFASELSRVARAGFAQVPSRQAELTFGWPYHPWLIDRSGDTLVFEPKGERRAPCGDYFHRTFAQSQLLRIWWSAHRSDWLHSIEWRGAISARVEGAATAERTAAFDVERTIAVLFELKGRGVLVPLDENIRGTLRCPACEGSLASEHDRISCRECGRDYPSPGGVPVLLEEAVDSG
jgi:uncharacterized protein YbaR (Trm112 family)